VYVLPNPLLSKVHIFCVADHGLHEVATSAIHLLYASVSEKDIVADLLLEGHFAVANTRLHLTVVVELDRIHKAKTELNLFV
jgi:hypothetical protein